ncbi:MAG: metX hom [Gemmatimonadetes bacterium]|nr:metX hom [Gemmatimonadota bacterium]
MDSHDVGRGRGGAGKALRRAAAHLTGVGIPGDLLYPADDVRRWTDAACVEYREIASPLGHDAFLLEHDQVAAILSEALAAGRVRPSFGDRSAEDGVRAELEAPASFDRPVDAFAPRFRARSVDVADAAEVGG